MIQDLVRNPDLLF